MPGAGQTHHVMFKDSSGGNKTGLRLLEDEEGKLLYGWELAPALAPGVESKDVQYGQYDPSQELVWSQDDWQGGALRFYYNPRDPAKYAVADGVWALSPNELSTAGYAEPLTFGVLNGSFEMGDTTGWSHSGLTLTVVTTAPYRGIYHLQAASFATSDYAYSTLANGTRWAGAVVMVQAFVRGSAAGGTLRVQIVETGGASTPTTSGTGVVLTTTYQQISATVTLQSDTTGIDIRIQMEDDGGSARTVYIDDVNAYAGGTTTPHSIATPVNLRQLVQNGKLLLATESAVWLYTEITHYWALQKYFGQAITGAEVFDDRLFIGQGESTAYQYSDVADPATWTVSTIASTGKNANYFGKTLNANGNWALAKTLNDDDVHLATDPTNTGSWGSAINVGKDDHGVTNVYNLGGTIAVGKQDGFYQFLSLDGSQFVNVYPMDSAVNSRNFRRGIVYENLFWTVVNDTGLSVFNGVRWQSMNWLFRTPGFSEFGNSIKGFGTDGEWLYLALEDSTAPTTDKTCYLLAVQNQESAWVCHTIASFKASDVIDMVIWRDAAAAAAAFNRRFIYIHGNDGSSDISYRFPLPERSNTPRRSTYPLLPLTSTFITSYWDGNRPQVQKVAHDLDLITEELTANVSITVDYQKDNETSWTAINASDATFNTSPYETIAFTAGTTFRRIRLRFTFTSNVTTATAVLKAFVLHMHWRPDRLQQWLLVGAIEDGLRGLQGAAPALPAKQMLTQLATLRDAKADVTFTDIDGTTHTGHIVDMKETQVKGRVGSGGQAVYSRGVQILFQEG